MQRLRSSGSKIFPSLVVPQLKRKVSNSLSAVQDTYFSTKDIFERHRVVFTVATSIASVATAWAGYSMRHYHQSKMEERLESIEKSIKSNHHIEHDEIKKIVNSGTVSIPACIATAGTSLIIGAGLPVPMEQVSLLGFNQRDEMTMEVMLKVIILSMNNTGHPLWKGLIRVAKALQPAAAPPLSEIVESRCKVVAAVRVGFRPLPKGKHKWQRGNHPYQW